MTKLLKSCWSKWSLDHFIDEWNLIIESLKILFYSLELARQLQQEEERQAAEAETVERETVAAASSQSPPAAGQRSPPPPQPSKKKDVSSEKVSTRFVSLLYEIILFLFTVHFLVIFSWWKQSALETPNFFFAKITKLGI